MNLFKRKSTQYLYIRILRYVFGLKHVSILDGSLKGYRWLSSSSYEYLTGEYEDSETLKMFESALSLPNVVFYDIGANIGYYSFLANRIIEKGAIYAFEPMPGNIENFKKLLQANASKLRPTPIEILSCAVSDKEQDLVFSNNEATTEGNTYVDSPYQPEGVARISVKSYSIDSFVEIGNPMPDVLKIDVEGAEFDVLKGATNTLKKNRPVIFLATHDCHVKGVKTECIDFLTEHGYEIIQSSIHKKSMIGLDDFIAFPKERSRAP